MNIHSIKTEDQLCDLGDIWRNRAFKLNPIWQNEDESQERRAKAFAIWSRLLRRIQAIAKHIQSSRYVGYPKKQSQIIELSKEEQVVPNT